MQLNPSEISELIKSKIQNLAVSSDLRTQGTVVSVTDGICRVHGLTDVMQGEMLEFPGGAFGMALNLERDSVGARITELAEGVPVGWGEPVFDRLDADIAHAMMGINAVKGVEIGARFASIAQRGRVHSDELTPSGFVTNHAGGILGGITSGQAIRVNVALKPTSSIPQERRSIDKNGNAITMQTTGRHDPCVGVRATPIAEAMLALVLMDHALRHRAQNADVVSTIPKI